MIKRISHAKIHIIYHPSGSISNLGPSTLGPIWAIRADMMLISECHFSYYSLNITEFVYSTITVYSQTVCKENKLSTLYDHRSMNEPIFLQLFSFKIIFRAFLR